MPQKTQRHPLETGCEQAASELEVPFSPDQVRWRVTNTTNDKKRARSCRMPIPAPTLTD